MDLPMENKIWKYVQQPLSLIEANHSSNHRTKTRLTKIFKKWKFKIESQISSYCCWSVAQSRLTFCNPYRLQEARLPDPSLSPRVCSKSCPLSQWCHPTISSSVSPFSSCLQSFPTLGSFPMSWLWFRWPRYWYLSLSISPFNKYSGLISFRKTSFKLSQLSYTVKLVWCI